MFTDELRHKAWDDIRQHGLRAFSKLLPEEVFVGAAKLAGVRLGRNALSLVQLVRPGTSIAMHCPRGFASILQLTLKLLEDSCDWHPRGPAKRRRTMRKSRHGHRKASKHSPHGGSSTRVTELLEP